MCFSWLFPYSKGYKCYVVSMLISLRTLLTTKSINLNAGRKNLREDRPFDPYLNLDLTLPDLFGPLNLKSPLPLESIKNTRDNEHILSSTPPHHILPPTRENLNTGQDVKNQETIVY